MRMRMTVGINTRWSQYEVLSVLTASRQVTYVQYLSIVHYGRGRTAHSAFGIPVKEVYSNAPLLL